jgi:hypothetical protein
LVFAGTLYVIIDKKIQERRFMLFLLVQFYVYLLVISVGTKNFWYDAPLFPIAAMFLGLLIRALALRLQNRYWRWGILLLFVSGIVFPGYASAIRHAMAVDGNKAGEVESLNYYLKEEKQLPVKFTVLFEAHASSLYFYREMLKGRSEIQVLKLYDMQHREALRAGDTVLMTTQVRSVLNDLKMEVIQERPGCAMVIVK